MITQLGTQSWTSEVLTGNGEFLETSPGTFYVVSNSLSNGTFQIFKSTDHGNTFTATVTYTFPTVGDIAFDPAISYDGTLVHIIGAVTNATNSTLTDLVVFTLTPGSTDTLSAPSIVITGTRIHSGYDIVSQSDGTSVIVTAVTNPTVPTLTNDYTLVGIVLASNNTVSSITPLLAPAWAASTMYVVGNRVSYGGVGYVCIKANTSGSSFVTDKAAGDWAVESIRTGETYGAVSLTTDGTTVEAYYTAHLKVLTFGSALQQIRVRTFHSGVWSAETVVYYYASNFIDTKLTVLPLTDPTYDRVMSHLYYTQVGNQLSSTLLVGTRAYGTWHFITYTGSTTQTYMEPTLIYDSGDNIHLNYLWGNVNAGAGGLLVSNLLDPTTLKYTFQPGHYDQLLLTWLRGTKSVVDTASAWAVIGEQTPATPTIPPSYTPLFVSFYNSPPVVSLVIDAGNHTTITPPIETVKRGAVTILDATGTFDPDYDPMRFIWSSDDGTGLVQLIPVAGNPALLNVVIPNQIGPSSFTVHITVSVVDLAQDGLTPLHSPVTATATLTVATTAPPVVTWDPALFTYNSMTSQWDIPLPRNSTVALVPTIVGSYGATASFATNVMTLQTVPSEGEIAIGQTLQGAGGAPNALSGLTITGLLSGVLNEVGSTYSLSGTVGTIATEDISTGSYYPLTYSWAQISGTPIPILNSTSLSYLWILLSGTYVLGSTVVFQVTVSDGINTPVVSTVAVAISAINTTALDRNFISRAVYSTPALSSITTRNNPTDQSAWGTIEVGLVTSDFVQMKISRNSATGARRQTYIGDYSIAIIGEEGSGDIYYRKVFLLGNDRGKIVDAVLLEDDDLMVLTDDHQLLRYTDLGLYNISDYYQNSIDLSSYFSANTEVMWFSATPSFNGSRVFAFATSAGAFLIQVAETGLVLGDVLLLSTSSFNLYGGDYIVFIRFQQVESLRQGTILVGSLAPKTQTSALQYFETVFDLSLRSIVNVWDRTSRINQSVVTGEFLSNFESNYTGVLQAPILTLTQNTNTAVTLTWTQVRPDLVETYQVFGSSTPGVSVAPLSDATS